MNLSEIHSYKSRVENLFRLAKGLAPGDELQGHLAKYLCILISGLLEVSFRMIFTQHAQAGAAPKIARFVENRLLSFQNAKMSRIIEWIRSFDVGWAEKLESHTEGELRDAVDGVVANKNAIAHGRSTGISLGTIEKYYRNVIKVIDAMVNLCEKDEPT